MAKKIHVLMPPPTCQEKYKGMKPPGENSKGLEKDSVPAALVGSGAFLMEGYHRLPCQSKRRGAIACWSRRARCTHRRGPHSTSFVLGRRIGRCRGVDEFKRVLGGGRLSFGRGCSNSQALDLLPNKYLRIANR